MNKKTIGSIFIALSLILAFLQTSLFLPVSILILGIILNLEEDDIKKISQILALLFSVLIVEGIFKLIFGNISNVASVNFANFYLSMMNWIGFILDIYLFVFLIVFIVYFILGKNVPLYGYLVDSLFNRVNIFKNKKTNKKTHKDIKQNKNDESNKTDIENLDVNKDVVEVENKLDSDKNIKEKKSENKKSFRNNIIKKITEKAKTKSKKKEPKKKPTRIIIKASDDD